MSGKNKCANTSMHVTCWFFSFFIVSAFVASCTHGVSSREQAALNGAFRRVDSSYTRLYYYPEPDIKYLDSVFATVKDAGVENTAHKYLYKSYYYGGPKANYDSALLYADSCINLAQDFTENKAIAQLCADAYYTKGNIYFLIKNYDEAIRNYTLQKIIHISSKLDSCLLYNYYHSMAKILYAQQKYLLAAQFFRMKFITAAACLPDPYISYLEVQENMSNTGMCYYKVGQTDSAWYYYNATLNFIDKNEKRFPLKDKNTFIFDRAVVYNNQADVLQQQKDFAGAEKLYLQSVEGTQNSNDTGFVVPLRLSLAALYLQTDQVEKTGDVLRNMAGFINRSEISSKAGNYYKLLSDYYIKKNKPLEANSSLLQAYNIRDSLEKRDRQFAAIDVRREFENKEVKAINQALIKNSEIKNGYLFIAVIGATMSVIIIFMVWHNLRLKSGYVKKLTSLNAEINWKNDDLQKTLSSLEQSHKENNRLMRVVAHDLKNPISAIRTLIFSLLRREQTVRDREALELIQATCVDSISLIKDLLDNKRNLSDISKELVDMGRMIEQCTQLLQIKAGEKHQQLKLQVDYPVIMLNRQQMWRVISNIVTNAIKFSPENGEIMIRLERKKDIVLLSVQDYGIGIPSSLKDKIFIIDADVSREGTAGEESYGMGLSISKKIIEEHHGKFWFESEEGKGSVFYVELPYHAN